MPGQAQDRADAFDAAHRALLADSGIQFELQPPERIETPAWLQWLGEVLTALFPVLRVLFWVGLGVLALYLLYMIGRRIYGSHWPWRRDVETEENAPSWRPAEAPARQLLSEADALAAEGRFSEAGHLLLFRSIEDIEKRRPNLVRPALTSRDIAGLPEIPAPPRRAFERMVMMVERSLFGGRSLGEHDWRDCRTAYEEFAFAEGWRG